jgi:hypothetical protein
MSVSPNDIEVGKCYVTEPNHQVRKVLEVIEDMVRYATGGSDSTKRDWKHWERTTKDQFAAEVDREVTCDWDPKYPERPVSKPEPKKKKIIKKKKPMRKPQPKSIVRKKKKR